MANDSIEHLLKNLTPLELPAGLTSRIVLVVHQAYLRTERRKAALFIAADFLATGSLVWSVKFAFDELYNSEFGTYLSLVASDFGTFLHYPREFILLLAESLPIPAILALSAAAFFMLLVSKFAARSVEAAFLSNNYRLAR